MVGNFFVVQIDWRYEMPIILTSLQSLDRFVDHVIVCLCIYPEKKPTDWLSEWEKQRARTFVDDGHTFDNDDFSIKIVHVLA